VATLIVASIDLPLRYSKVSELIACSASRSSISQKGSENGDSDQSATRMPLPGAAGSEATWNEWVRSLRPTTSVADTVARRDLPLRVICAASLWPDGNTMPELKVVQPQDWNFVAISHRWLENPEWEAYRRPYPADHLGMKVTAVSKKSLYLLASICRTMGFQYFWLDCICIDQGSALEKAREGRQYGKLLRQVCPHSHLSSWHRQGRASAHVARISPRLAFASLDRAGRGPVRVDRQAGPAESNGDWGGHQGLVCSVYRRLSQL